jgi:biotin carboxyl carrier protein
MWHPWGFFVATLATTAIIISIADNDVPTHYDMASVYFPGADFTAIDKQLLFAGPAFEINSSRSGPVISRSENARLKADGSYYYDQGVFYLKGDGGYTVVAAPLGAKIKTLPSGYETVTIDDKGTKNYYYGGSFFEKISDGYKVVAPMAGTVVEHISEGGEEVKLGDVTYVKFGETYFQPIQENGKNMYEVVDVEEDK